MWRIGFQDDAAFWRAYDEKLSQAAAGLGLASLPRADLEPREEMREAPDHVLLCFYAPKPDRRVWEFTIDKRWFVALIEQAVPHALERPSREMLELAIALACADPDEYRRRIHVTPVGEQERRAADVVVKFIEEHFFPEIRHDLAQQPIKRPARAVWVPDQPAGDLLDGVPPAGTCHLEWVED